MEEWKKYKATDYCLNVTDGTHDSPKRVEQGKYLITSKHIKGNQIDFSEAYKISLDDYNQIIKRSKVDQWDVIISMIGAYCGFCYIEISPNTDYAIKNVGLFKVGSELKSRWLYYYLSSPLGKQQLALLRTGSSQPYIALNSLRNLMIPVPEGSIMRRIVNILHSLDDKIEVNRRINDNLEQQAQALFKSWFVDFEPFKDGEFVESELGMIPKGWQVTTLTSIANYLNGLAMQKFRPVGEDKGIPVLKIKELGQGTCDSSSDRCSSQIDEQYKVNDGDIIFSWSGTLLVDSWCGGVCGLNQHLFKVTSKEFPKWFYYMWTKEHLNNFIHIAKDKAVTMGHIKRGHLEEAKVLVPPQDVFGDMTKTMQPIIEEIIGKKIENRKLAQLRDTLLPRLMSGELNVNEITA